MVGYFISGKRMGAEEVTVDKKGGILIPKMFRDKIVHFDEKCQPLFLEILKASKIVPLMVEGLAKKEAIVA